MIKDDFLDNIIRIFHQDGRFEYIDFKIDINQDTLKIIYIIEPDFYLKVQDKNHFKEKNENENFDIFGEAAPGQFALHDCFSLTQKTEVYTKIKQWLDNIWKEITYTSLLGTLEKEQEQINEICKKFDSMEGYFTTDEIITIRKELDLFKSELETEIKSMTIGEYNQKSEIEKMTKHFETLKEMASYLKKKGWIRSLTGRVFHNMRRLYGLQQQNILKDYRSSK